jgi:alkanesulfonate monooxygenase SsuD/methylene tetrahydromethanopterin reductase-like flavin-dependent oxidoreductase (luciferase family)
VLFGFLGACTTRIGLSTQGLILPKRQTLLVAKQAACLCRRGAGGRFGLASTAARRCNASPNGATDA